MCPRIRAQKLHRKSHISIKKEGKLNMESLQGRSSSIPAYVRVTWHTFLCRHTWWALPWACPMSSKSEIEPENTSIKFLSNADGREAIWRITLLGSILQAPWLWTVGPGNPQSQTTIPLCFPTQWRPEPWRLGVGKFFSAHTALQTGCQWERDF